MSKAAEQAVTSTQHPGLTSRPVGIHAEFLIFPNTCDGKEVSLRSFWSAALFHFKTCLTETSDCGKGGWDEATAPDLLLSTWRANMPHFVGAGSWWGDSLLLFILISMLSIIWKKKYFSYQGSSFFKTHLMGTYPAKNLPLGLRTCK